MVTVLRSISRHYIFKKIVHANLKFSNLLVGKDEKAKVSNFDFGFCFCGASKLPEIHGKKEGVRWNAPERLRGEVELPTYKSDVYSFRLCIIEAFSNDVPWGLITSNEEIASAAFDMRNPNRSIWYVGLRVFTRGENGSAGP